MLRSALLLAAFLTTASAQTYSGRLAPGDETLDSGEYLDEYAVQARAGQTVRAVVTSDDFDTYLIVKSGSGEQEDNDDCTDGELTRSCAALVADRDGRVRVLVTSFSVGETGDYQVVISTDGAGGGTAGWGSDRTNSTGRGAVMGEVVEGRLAAGDETLASGEFFDRHALRLDRGDRVTLSLRSSDFDPYLILQAPDGTQQENDDCTEGDYASCLDLVVDQDGTWDVLITSFAPDETGAYTLSVGGGEGVGGARPGPSGPAGGVRTERGALERGDATLSSGEFSDRYSVAGTGGPLVVDLRSTDFDPYLIVETPGGDQFDNDDHEGSLERSLLVVQTRAGETYDVVVTSYAPGETGQYSLDLRSDDASSSAGVRTETGALGPGDETLDSGEYVDVYTFDGVPGQRLRADLTSDDFDTYVVVRSPTGQMQNDDDGGGRVGHSLLEMDLTEPGTYTVAVTSFSAGETGAYRLALDLTERFGQVTESQAPPGTSGGEGRSRAYSAPSASRAGLDLDQTFSGQLDGSDQRLSSGEFMEVHTFDGEAGEPIRVEMSSSAFDTYLIVEAPTGDQIENDDVDGSTDRSVVEFSMPATGRYRVIATSYRPGETGAYQIRLSQADALAPEPLAYDRIVGLFVGISDYDRMSDLQWTAQDAGTARDAMIEAGMDPSDGITLTDAQATDANVRAAIQRLAARSDDRTLFVLFFSGHGGQYDRAGGFQRADPDGLDESLELFDREMLDDDLDQLLASVPAGRQLIVLDACYSGGFAKDVISRPGRMGLFSSEEDVLSSVAVKFEAGGYLSRFFSEAVADRQADTDGNGAVTALELSLYLDDRFDAEVQSEGGGLLGSREFQTEHQKLVVDRGSVGLYESLFLFRP